ncbi:hypothetical protein [Nocardia sp. NPDC003183]
MSKKKNAAAAPTAPATPTPETAAPAPEHGSGRPVVPVLDKPATRALWAALGDNPGSTTAALADAAGIGVSTARRLLAGWETAGAARSATDPESPRAAKTWTTEPAAPEPATEPATPEPAAPEPAAEPATPEPAAPEPAAEPATPEPAAEPATPEPAAEPVNPQPGPAVPAAPEPVTPEPDSAEPDSAEPAAPELTAPEPVSLEPATPDPTEPAEEAAPADPAPDSAPDTAAPAPTGDDPATPAPAPVTPAPPAEPAAADAESTVERLPAGALRGQVEDYLRDNPGKEFSPHQIGKALERSSGAVHNALVKLAKDGTARQTSTAPKRFILASA